MFESLLRIVLSVLAVGTFMWLMSEVSLRYSGRFSSARMILSLGSMFTSVSILAYIMAPVRDVYLQAVMELCLIIGAGCLGLGVIMLPIVKWRQRRRDMQ